MSDAKGLASAIGAIIGFIGQGGNIISIGSTVNNNQISEVTKEITITGQGIQLGSSLTTMFTLASETLGRLSAQAGIAGSSVALLGDLSNANDQLSKFHTIDFPTAINIASDMSGLLGAVVFSTIAAAEEGAATVAIVGLGVITLPEAIALAGFLTGVAVVVGYAAPGIEKLIENLRPIQNVFNSSSGKIGQIGVSPTTGDGIQFSMPVSIDPSPIVTVNVCDSYAAKIDGVVTECTFVKNGDALVRTETAYKVGDDGNQNVPVSSVVTTIPVSVSDNKSESLKLEQYQMADALFDTNANGSRVTTAGNVTLVETAAGSQSLFAQAPATLDLSTLNGARAKYAYGSTGNDTIVGSSGNDILVTGGGDDVVQAGAGNDTLYLTGDESADHIDMGDGIDTLVVTGSQGATLNLAQAHAEIAFGGDGNYWVDPGRSYSLFYSVSLRQLGDWEQESSDFRFSHPAMSSVAIKNRSPINKNEKINLLSHRGPL